VIEPLLADEALLADIAEASNPRDLYVWWLGQSGFLFKHAGRHLLVDPYLAGGGVFVCPTANRELATARIGREPDVCLSDGKRFAAAGFELEAVPAAHPELAPEYAGYVVRCDGMRVYHSGDTELYPGMAERVGAVDLALLPINGALANMGGVDAVRLACALPAGLVVPCHYDMFEFNTASPDAFAVECERMGQPFRLLRLGERLSIPPPPRA
jgi:L-ascorbate metabolism protein UlaG (beta-lactamase superfamily)